MLRCEHCGNEYEPQLVRHPDDPNRSVFDDACPVCGSDGIPLVRCGACGENLLPTEFVFDGSTADEITDGDLCRTCYRELERVA